jgi:hypothetical protein
MLRSGNHEAFSGQYARAREIGYHEMADGIFVAIREGWRLG